MRASTSTRARLKTSPEQLAGGRDDWIRSRVSVTMTRVDLSEQATRHTHRLSRGCGLCLGVTQPYFLICDRVHADITRVDRAKCSRFTNFLPMVPVSSLLNRYKHKCYTKMCMQNCCSVRTDFAKKCSKGFRFLVNERLVSSFRGDSFFLLGFSNQLICAVHY